MVKIKVYYKNVLQEDRGKIEEVLKQQTPEHHHPGNYWYFQKLTSGEYEISRITWRPIQKENIDAVVDFLSRYFNVSKD